MKKSMKRLVAILCMLVMLCGLVPAFNLGQVKAETTEQIVVVDRKTSGSVEKGGGMNETCSEDGYVFGGYYENEECTIPLKEDRDATTEKPVYIKWVHEQAMNVAAQACVDEYEGLKKVISSCDITPSDDNDSEFKYNSKTGEACSDEGYVQEGQASLKQTVKINSAAMVNLFLKKEVDVTGYKYFSCKLYIEDVNKLTKSSDGYNLQIVLSSDGSSRTSGALCFNLTLAELETYKMASDGWYELNLPFAQADHINVGEGTDSNDNPIKIYDGTKIGFIQIRQGQGVSGSSDKMTVCIDDIYVYNENPGVVLADCDQLNLVRDADAANGENTFTSVIKTGTYDSLETAMFKEGVGALKAQCFRHSQGTYRLFSVIGFSDANKLNISNYVETGSIHLWLYIEKQEYLTDDFIIQLSSDMGDNERIRYTIDKDNLGSGWNEVIQPLNDSAAEPSDDGGIDWDNVNYIRVYTTGAIGNGIAADDEQAEEKKTAQMQAQYMLVDDIRIVDSVQIMDCDSTDQLLDASLGVSVAKDDVKEGSGAFVQTDRDKSTVHQLVFNDAIDFSGFKGKNGSLHFWFYIESTEDWNTTMGLLVGLSSNGKYEAKNAQDYYIQKKYIRDGWNEIYINLDDTTSDTAGLDQDSWKKINCITISCQGKGGTLIKTMIDDISLVTSARNTAAIRFISTVESLKYQEVGFYIKPFRSQEYESVTDWEEYYNVAENNVLKTDYKTIVYSQLYAIGQDEVDDTVTAETVFDPEGAINENYTGYMHAATVVNIPNRLWDAKFVAVPYWKTQDGTTVTGSPKPFTINELVSKTKQEQVETDFRVLITSDIHATTMVENRENYYYGVSLEDRMQLWVDSIRAEHRRKPIDLIIVNGDVSLDFWGVGGYYLAHNKVGETKTFVENYISQLQGIAPVMVMPGNHEQYSDADWQALTGNGRSGTYVLGNNLFIMLDSYAVIDTAVEDSDGTYTTFDVNALQQQISQYPDHKVYMISHHIDMTAQRNADDGAFETLLQENDNIIGLFAGHTHMANVYSYGRKKVAQTGHFSYFTSSIGEADRTTDNFWGFRDLIITAERASSRYITVDCNLYKDVLTGVISSTGNYNRRELYGVSYNY